jgi:hypothetical protein
MNIKLITLFVCIVVSISVLSNEATACSCKMFTPCEAFGNASIVFIGRAMSGTDKRSSKNAKGETIEWETGTVTFSVEESFKNISVTQISINVTGGCDPLGFTKGERYLVYAREYQGKLVTGSCSRGGGVDSTYTKEDMDFLHNLPKEGTGGRLYGQIGVEKGGEKPAPLAGITVIVENEMHEQFKAVTDSEGGYEISGLKPGKYQVTPLLPEHYDVYSPMREVLISDRGCATTSYWAKVTGSISGRIVDEEGRTAPAYLRLVAINNEKQRFSDIAYDNGEFEIDGVPPGRYLLYLETLSVDKDSPAKSKEQAFYYPGVFERDKATIIEFGMGEQQKGYGFTLPSPLKVQTITGVIQYPDGRAAANAAVILSIQDKTTPGIYGTDDSGGRIETDETGRFEIHAFKGNTYELEAQEDGNAVLGKKRRQLYSQPLRIKLEGDVKDVKLVLTSPTSSFDRLRMQQQKKTP